MMYQPARNADLVTDDQTFCPPQGEADPPPLSEFHRVRAEAEMEQALSAGPLSVALCHLELARLHRERRAALGPSGPRKEVRAFCPIDRTDKEG